MGNIGMEQMNSIYNIFDQETLKTNIMSIGFFILLFEHYKDNVIDVVKDIHSMYKSSDGEFYYSVDKEYINILKNKLKNNPKKKDSLILEIQDCENQRNEYLKAIHVIDANGKYNNNFFQGSLDWLESINAISHDDNIRVKALRKRRNSLVHDMFENLQRGLTDDDASMIADLLVLNKKLNSWRFNEYEIPIMGSELPEGSKPESVLGGDDIAFQAIFRILYCNEGDEFKKLLEELELEQK